MVDEALIIKNLLKNAVHDIKNLLSPVFLYAEMLGESSSGKQNQEKAGVILKKAEEMDQYLNALRLLYSQETWFEGRSLPLLMERISLLCRTLFRSNGKTLYFRYSKEIQILEEDVSEKGFGILSKILFVAEHDVKGKENIFWLTVKKESGKLLWSIYQGKPPADLSSGGEIAALSPSEISKLEKTFGEPLTHFS